MAPRASKYRIPFFWLILICLILYFFYAEFTIPLDYKDCELCDRHEYKKVYEYFEYGAQSQIKHPFYMRPIVPMLAAMIPISDMNLSFHSVNFMFMVLSVIMLGILWKYLKVRLSLQLIGFSWLCLHWTGLIRYNLMDFITVDVPVYFFGALALYFFLQKRYLLFYVLSPIAILQKESFIPILVVFICVTIYRVRHENWITESIHLLGALAFGLMIQRFFIDLMPEQMDQRSSTMALLYHIKLALLDPTRFIRWFAALGTAYGLFPVIIALQFRWRHYQDRLRLSLALLSLMFVVFGLTAGEDMTRIIFLGFPFIMTLSLMVLSREHPGVVISTLLLSLPVLRLYPISGDLSWAVDYASMDYVLAWAVYYVISIVAIIVLRRAIISRARRIRSMA